MTVARSVADVVSDHVVFEVESIDRMYLNVWVPRLAYGGGVQGFFVGHRGHHYASTALMDPMTKAFVAGIHGFVAARGLELVSFGKERKDDVAQQFLARFTGSRGGAVRRPGAGEGAGVAHPAPLQPAPGSPTRGWFAPPRSSTTSTSIAWTTISARSSSSSAPTSPTPPSCASTATSGPNARPPRPGSRSSRWTTGSPRSTMWTALQAICDSLGPDADRRVAAQVAGASCRNPFTDDDEAAGYRYELSILQAEFSLTQMLDRPGRRGGSSSSRCSRDNLDIGRPDQVEPDLRPADHQHGPPAGPRAGSAPGSSPRGHPVAARRLQAHQDQAVPQLRREVARDERLYRLEDQPMLKT